MHLFVDISSHGFGHLAITAPVLAALAERLPGLRLTVRTRLPQAILDERLPLACQRIDAASDFGYVMHDATRINAEASAQAYRQAHANWPERVSTEAGFLAELKPDLVLSNVSYLALAGAAQAGIPALAICSLNWADLFAHFFGHHAWSTSIHAQMLVAYRSARTFLRITPGMPMATLDNLQPIGPIAALGRRHDLGLGGDKAVLIAMGGITHRLPVEDWPRQPGLRWIVPGDWACSHPDAITAESFGLGFTDLLCSVDAVITKPGYGTFTEAACNGTPVLYQRRDDWPEQDCLIDWLHQYGRGIAVGSEQLLTGNIHPALHALWAQTAPAPPRPDGAAQAATRLIAHLP